MTSSMRILVADDNHSLVNLVEGILKKAGYQVLTAFDGREALIKARKEKPDLIILDIIMPFLDGYQVCAALQKDPATSSIPILMLTVKGQVNNESAHTVESHLYQPIRERMQGFEVGAMEFMSKPVSAKDLLERVRGLLWLG